MIGLHDLPLFILAGLLLNMTPGPDSLLVVTRSAAHGWQAGSAASLGIGAGILVHVFAAALGLSAILATSAAAFTVVKLVGAAYLLYIGIGLLFSRNAKSADAAATQTAPTTPTALPYRKVFAQGFLTNVLNPKVALFFLAFVPQFISPDAPNKALAFIVLGGIFNLNGMLWCHLLAFATAFASRRLQPSRNVALWINRLIGAVFVSMGLKLAFAERT